MAIERTVPRSRSSASWRTRLAVSSLVVVFVLGGCGLLPKEEEIVPTPIPTPAETSKATYVVRRGDIIETMSVNGRLSASQEALLYFTSNGRIQNVLVSAGDRVSSGDVLAELDAGDLDTRVAIAEINLRKAQAKFEQSRSKNADRFELQMAQFDVDSARITYDNLKQQLDASQLVAPFNGIVTDVQGRPGETVQAYTPLLTVSNPEELEMTGELLNEGDATRIAVGQRAEVILDRFPDTRLNAELSQMPNTAATTPDGRPLPSTLRRSFKLKLLDPVPQGAEMGMLGRVTITLREKKDVLILPNAAIRSFGGRRYVQIDSSGRRREIDVQVGIITQTETEITDGLKEGDQVIGQ